MEPTPVTVYTPLDEPTVAAFLDEADRHLADLRKLQYFGQNLDPVAYVLAPLNAAVRLMLIEVTALARAAASAQAARAAATLPATAGADVTEPDPEPFELQLPPIAPDLALTPRAWCERYGITARYADGRPAGDAPAWDLPVTIDRFATHMSGYAVTHQGDWPDRMQRDLRAAAQAADPAPAGPAPEPEPEPELTPDLTLQPQRWCDRYGVEIKDDDGWRGPDAPSWFEPITLEEFAHRLGKCTMNQLGPWLEPIQAALLDVLLQRLHIALADATAQEERERGEAALEPAGAIGAQPTGEADWASAATRDIPSFLAAYDVYLDCSPGHDAFRTTLERHSPDVALTMVTECRCGRRFIAEDQDAGTVNDFIHCHPLRPTPIRPTFLTLAECCARYGVEVLDLIEPGSATEALDWHGAKMSPKQFARFLADRPVVERLAARRVRQLRRIIADLSPHQDPTT